MRATGHHAPSHISRAFGAACLAAVSYGTAQADELRVHFPDSPPRFAHTYTTTAPAGYEAWCRRAPANCERDDRPMRPVTVKLTRENWAQLNSVNLLANRSIEGRTDLEVYGQLEYWTIPANGKGDCEDYMLAKREELIRLGWPRSALLMTTVRIPATDTTPEEGHALLIAVTDRGMLALDNKRDDIRLWSETGYTFLASQNPSYPHYWSGLSEVRIGPWQVTIEADPVGSGRGPGASSRAAIGKPMNILPPGISAGQPQSLRPAIR